MSLTRDLRVSSEIRSRGEEYFASGAVRQLQRENWAIYAVVSGTYDYEVDIYLSDDDRSVEEVYCDCPYFDEHGTACKHIWAVLLAADRRWPDLAGATYPRLHQEPTPTSKKKSAKNAAPAWKKQLSALRTAATRPNDLMPARPASPSLENLAYVVNRPLTLERGQLSIEVAQRTRKTNGEWSKPKIRRPDSLAPGNCVDPLDRQILALLRGSNDASGYYSYYYSDSCFTIGSSLWDTVLPLMCSTGRTVLSDDPLNPDTWRELAWEPGPPWQFWLEFRPDERASKYMLTGALRRNDQQIPLAVPYLLLDGGLVFLDGRIYPLQNRGSFYWISLLRQHPSIEVPLKQADQFMDELFSLPDLPHLDLPDDLRVTEAKVIPKPLLKILPPHRNDYSKHLRAQLSFDYDGRVISHFDKLGSSLFDSKGRRLILRDLPAEAAAADRLVKLGVREQWSYYSSAGGKELFLPKNKLPKLVRTLIPEGWHVEAEGKLYRQPGQFDIQVTSGIDWFELNAKVDFNGVAASLPTLLAALQRGDNIVELGDGTFGMLPEDWLRKYGFLAKMGTPEDGRLRFKRTQAGLLDALLASQPQATCDEAFERTRQELRRFDGVQPLDPPGSFQGQLRCYQRDAIGWFDFLRRFGFGGCLADDMGLGKTVQVLALLESRRQLRGQQENEADAGEKAQPIPPSLVVVPKSLVFNWQQEADRFTPQLRVLDHTGMQRRKATEHLSDYDLVITTYGTLRRDAAFLKDTEFDYVILDEAQAIKNPSSDSAKAARLLNARHRLALSGTPVQNHLGDLWSLFDFLNPGMLGSASVFADAGSALRNPAEETRAMLARAVRPFILRRTKEQVAKDLPQRLEQTLYCELDKHQRKLYDELRDHYRASLLKHIEVQGINRSKVQILEALLRLRQAALHTALIDKSHAAQSSAKLDLLLPQLQEVTDEGHKALVFSQFTSMLAIVREKLDAQKIPYEYLDGRTHDREAHVRHFQEDPECKLFLISLKAGGLGLNLTAADYVFLLDPWWNPAVEAQAIDRTHRIGQTKQVYACRLIAKDTVEEKVLALQQTKRDLADAIITADNSVMRTLGREELELLLS